MDGINETLSFLKEAKTYYLGTINNGKPDIRPFGTIHLYKNRLYFQTGKIKAVYKQLKENENINICSFLNGCWIRIDAKAIEDESFEANKSILDAYPELSGMYKAGDGNTTVFYLKDAHVRICSFTAPLKEFNF